jgi:adenylylsulfate kinase
MAFHENHSRSLVKTITYRVLIIVSNSIIVYLLTRRVDMTVAFITTTNIARTVLYFLHERAWNRVHWGKRHLKSLKK